MHRFFVNKDNIKDSTIIIDGDDVNHITKVLRLKKEEEIIVCDGNKNEYICEINQIDKKEILCKIKESKLNENEPEVEITLFQGLPKAQKMDLIIQKCVEIGVVRIQPVITKRTVVKVEHKDLKGKLERWNRISEEAAKQSKRGIIPKVLEPINFEDAVLLMEDMDISILPYENQHGHGIKNVLNGETAVIKKVGIFIGPEGGFDEQEVKICLSKGIIPVTLGKRILRTETAGFAAAIMILYEIGDMGGNK